MQSKDELKEPLVDLFQNFVDERSFRSSNFNSSLTHAENLWNILLKTTNESESKIISDIKQLAKNLKYKHAGLGPQEYFLHPLRVGSIAGIANPEAKIFSAQIGLLHNVYEVTSLKSSDVKKIVGGNLEKIIAGLTIDRTLQSDAGYLQDYYGAISSFPHKLGMVKVIDKIDNLFTLNITANNEVKEKYLQEIENYVVPLCDFVSPQLSQLIRNIVKWVSVSA